MGMKLNMPFPRYDVLAKPQPDNDMMWEVQAAAAGDTQLREPLKRALLGTAAPHPTTPDSIRTRHHPAPGRMDGDLVKSKQQVDDFVGGVTF